MTISTRDILWHCKTTLQDAGATRWTLDELRRYINQATKQIALQMPQATSITKVMELGAGTYQELPEGESLLKAVRNITSAVGVTPRVSGKIVTAINLATLDSMYPNWHDDAKHPHTTTVTHVAMDPMTPRSFYVYPGNDGAGRIEVAVSVVPAEIDPPADINDLDSYTTNIGLPPALGPVVMDYVLYRAFSKDSDKQASAARAQAHYANYNSVLTNGMQTEAATGLAARTTTPAG